jgi:hypothetical protein
MNYTTVTPTPGSRWADTIAHITLAGAQALKTAAFTGVFLYAETVTQDDVDNALVSGLEVAFVMYSPDPGYQPSAALGTQMASSACAALKKLNIPAGVSLFVDLESMGGVAADKVAHANAAGDGITSGGFLAGAYIGAGVGLTSLELYHLHVVRYWKSGSVVYDRNGQLAEPACGWCAVQGMPFDFQVSGGPEVDLDVIWQDYGGRSVIAVKLAPEGAA